MDKVIDEEKEFIQNFALELTNRTLEERKEIGKKYYKQQKDLLDIQYKLVQALQEIRDIAEKMYNTNDEDVERDFYIKLQDKINEVIGAEE